jgi:hypothetical protein
MLFEMLKKHPINMNKLLRVFPVFALLLGTVLAFGAASKADLPQTKRANQNGTWIDVTGQVQGSDYRCSASSLVCTQLFDSNGNPIAGTQVSGTYSPMP